MPRRAHLVGWPLGADVAGPVPIRKTLERLIAVGYGLLYDAVVSGFGPYELLLDEIGTFIERSRSTNVAEPLRILDISCGVGTVATRLARAADIVVGIDAVEHLVAVARSKRRSVDVSFHHADIARGPVPWSGTYDVVVSMHTLYWHPDPEAMLAACRRMLRPGGHAVFLTYGRRARILRTFRAVRAAHGLGPAVRALRWLVPTALFEALRDCDHRYLSEKEFHGSLARAGFRVLESRETFLAGLSRLAWVRTDEHDPAQR